MGFEFRVPSSELDFKKWVKEQGSLTPCNQNLINNIEYRNIICSLPGEWKGFTTKSGNLSLSELFNRLEDIEFSELPENFREPISGLIGEEDWSAALRLVTLIFCSLENMVDPQPETRNPKPETATEGSKNGPTSDSNENS